MQKAAAFVLAVTVIAVAVVIGIPIISQTPISQPVTVHLSSDPFPSAVGNATLFVSLQKSDGTPVSGASVQLSALMQMPGMVPLDGRLQAEDDGVYRFVITWSNVGQWKVHVTAALPDESTVQDFFDLFVYAAPPFVPDIEARYRSASDIQAQISADPEHEYVIIIPQGTQAAQLIGHSDDLIPAEIQLSLNGQHTLVIRNDDIANHTVGPFFVRAGETVRQVFTRAATYQGSCTIRHGQEVSIIVS